MTDQQGHGPGQPDQPAQSEPNADHTGAQPFHLADMAPQPPMRGSRKRLIIIIAAVAVAVLLLFCGTGVTGLIGAGDAVNDAAQQTRTTATASASSPTTMPTTEAPAPTTAAPLPSQAAPKPRVIKGRGDDVVKIPPLTDLAVVIFKCPKCTSNTVLQTDGPEGLLVNEIGAYSGKRWINLEDTALTTQFEVQANSSWTLTIGTVEQLATKALSGTASGRGDDVVVLGGSASAAKITHSKGRSNFVVEAYSLETGEGGLLVNEIGGYSGTRPLTAPALVQVTADGYWTISPA
jgi:hypothetical protein